MKYLSKMPSFCGNKMTSLIFYFQPWVRKETLGLNFISTACALHSSTAGDGDTPAVQWVRGGWTCLLPCQKGVMDSRIVTAEQRLLQHRPWYCGKGGICNKDAPKMITKPISKKATVIFCKCLCFLWLKCGGRGLRDCSTESSTHGQTYLLCAAAVQVASQKREHKLNNEIHCTPLCLQFYRDEVRGGRRAERLVIYDLQKHKYF